MTGPGALGLYDRAASRNTVFAVDAHGLRYFNTSESENRPVVD